MFLPDDIDLSTPEKYILSIRIRPEGFSFMIHDPDDSKCFCFQETAFSNETSLLNNIQRIIFDLNFLTDNFRRTDVIFVTTDYELIPNDFYDKKHIKEIYNFTHSKESSLVLTNEEDIFDNKLIFGIDNELYLFLKRSLFNPHFYHQIEPLIEYFQKKASKYKGNSMFVHFHEMFIDLIGFDKNNNILFVKTYYKEHSLDILFFILSMWEKAKFDQLNDHLIIFGYYPSDNSQIDKTLKDYIRNIKDNGMFDQITDFGEKAQDIPLDLLILSNK